MCKTCSKLTITTPERSRRRSGVFIVDFEQVNDDAYTHVLMKLIGTLTEHFRWLLLTLNGLINLRKILCFL